MADVNDMNNGIKLNDDENCVTMEVIVTIQYIQQYWIDTPLHIVNVSYFKYKEYSGK